MEIPKREVKATDKERRNVKPAKEKVIFVESKRFIKHTALFPSDVTFLLVSKNSAQTNKRNQN